IADVVVNDIVFEVQLSKQSDTEYWRHSKDYWCICKEVYWVILKSHPTNVQAYLILLYFYMRNRV
ncbi:hypothetical protein JT359_20575, partial [Candidatus Poribacteria bacterium]|nr:hypothetical protein [Candidatus Poribacteria bacterium]